MSSDHKSLMEDIDHIETRAGLVDFIAELKHDFETNKDEWENADISSFLEAIGAWVTDMEGFYKNQDEPLPENVPWKLFANILYAAKYYE